MRTVGPDLTRESEREEILRSLLQWFGIEESLVAYVRNTSVMPTFAIEDGSDLVAFITLRRHFIESWEVHCVAVRPGYRGQGYGTVLLRHAEEWLLGQGARFLQVKTIAEESPDPSCARTRAFYKAKGYTRLEMFPTLWSPSNPVLQLIKALDAT